MNPKLKEMPGIFIPAFFGAAAAAFIYYCEHLQFLPFFTKGVIGRLFIAFAAGLLLFSVLFFLIRKGIREIAPREWFPILLVSLTASVCMMVWFDFPQTGLYQEHTLEICSLPDGNGETRPVTLTWLRYENGDIPLDSVRCEGNCSFGPDGPTIHDETGRIYWKGKTGNLVTIEFVSGEDQGIAEYSWNGLSHTAPLNNADMIRLSFDCSLPPSFGLSEFAAVWILSMLLCTAGVIATIKLLPGWDPGIFGAACFAVFLICRILQYRTVENPLYFIDSQSYLGLSRLSIPEIFSGAKFCHIEGWHCLSRPPLVPLIYKLCRQDGRTICLVQLAVSLLSWGYFSFTAACLCGSNTGRKICMILSFGLGCIPNVTRWDAMIMSESLSISTGVLFLGSLFWLTADGQRERWHRLPAACTAVSGIFFTISRDSAVWSVITVIILLICIAHLRMEKKLIFGLCAVLAAVCWFIMSHTGDRWQYSFENVLFNRILRDPQGEAFFYEAGMPHPPYIETLYRTEHVMATELFNSEEYAPLREWILSDGLKTYIRYMLHKPMKTLRMTWRDGFETEAFEKTDYRYAPSGFKTLIPGTILKLFSCNLPGVIIIGLALCAVLTAFRCSGGEKFAFPILFILSAYIMSTATYIADEYELDRHIMAITLMMKASAWPLIIMLCEKLCKANSRKNS